MFYSFLAVISLFLVFIQLFYVSAVYTPASRVRCSQDICKRLGPLMNLNRYLTQDYYDELEKKKQEKNESFEVNFIITAVENGTSVKPALLEDHSNPGDGKMAMYFFNLKTREDNTAIQVLTRIYIKKTEKKVTIKGEDVIEEHARNVKVLLGLLNLKGIEQGEDDGVVVNHLITERKDQNSEDGFSLYFATEFVARRQKGKNILSTSFPPPYDAAA